MKARVKETGEIFDIKGVSLRLTGKVLSTFGIDDVEVLMPDLTPDYWTRLEHQYAGMAMQGILSNQEYVHSLVQRVAGGEIPNLAEGITKYAEQLAHALVKKMKEERKW